jgi:hypothetical protein
VTLASFDDANDHLDGTKLSFTDNNDENFIAAAAAADPLVKAALYDLYPDHVSLWIETVPSPNPDLLEETPQLVRLIASLLYASYYYAKAYSEETLGENDYAKRLEERAWGIVTGLVAGTYQLYDALSYQSAVQGLQSLDFWPNDSTVVTTDDDIPGLVTGDPLRYFDMRKTF